MASEAKKVVPVRAMELKIYVTTATAREREKRIVIRSGSPQRFHWSDSIARVNAQWAGVGPSWKALQEGLVGSRVS